MGDRLLNAGCTSGPAETITLGMGCFWKPDALFGHLPGVIRTRTGYAGGTSADPNYRRMGDHTEVVEVDYDPAAIPLAKLLKLFWDSHNPVNINGYKGRQYQSLLLYRNEAQLAEALMVLEQLSAGGKLKPETEIRLYDRFFIAEDRHQKYDVKRYPHAVELLERLYPPGQRWEHGTLAARLNGLAKGYTSLQRVIAEMEQWPADAEEKSRLIRLVKQIRW
ncbi:peptide-methionine (S)-S-oxide reductase MsrA [Paenibacillus protaetiae]|uniref:Peptide methionine sulfoxide reductase MsrA n=1 Tax=Paenibacillus protaetiae TaxID=2509456 RepID=A0A4P6EVD8_9BACL|nr:peptide-methionine (S)-S-oxide reductase [Paenibacillus protaetiae]QAY67260.1 peptide-methionine (S)-S-oxide reductase [Paenibacillus protaetiae]